MDIWQPPLLLLTHEFEALRIAEGFLDRTRVVSLVRSMRGGTADRLAGFGGVAPVPRDSGKISGNLRRSRRYNRRLQRVFYISALFSIRHCENSRRFYDRKRAEGKRHIQAVLALARRRVNVLWALLRDGRRYELRPPPPLVA